MADVAQDEANEHEEEADEREGGGRADHLWGRGAKESENRSILHTQHTKWARLGGMAPALLLSELIVPFLTPG